MRTLATWLADIEASHPTEIDMGLERIAHVARALNIDFNNAAVITVAGTNGKGTTCAMTEAVCIEAGLSVGVYSSPHIFAFNERIRINGKDASDQKICKAFEQISEAKAGISLTYFEYATLAALLLFVQDKLDVVILEVGLGGRLDATNIVDADISVLTSIGLDHQDYLGHTLEQIAYEKAGIVKANKRCVIGYAEHYNTAAKNIDALHNQVFKRGVDFELVQSDATKSDVTKSDAINKSLSPETTAAHAGYAGWVQYEQVRSNFYWSAGHIPPANVMTALACVTFLRNVLVEKQNNTEVATQKLQALLNEPERMSNLINQVTLPGRAQVVSASPLIMLDVAHNEAAAQYLCEKIGTFDFSRCHIVIGMLKDKNVEQTIAALSELRAKWYCADLAGKRGEKGARLLNALPKTNSLQHAQFSSVEGALQSAIEQALNTDMIVVLGSFLTVAAATQYLTRIGLIGHNELAKSQ